jgi:DNA-binding transcriptional MerR regulator
MEEPWTILQLAELAADALAAGQPAGPSAGPSAGAARANGRVRDVPNERLVRWYVTVGLVDPPLSRRGRVAQYGRRHLLQLVAVKRLQAEGRSLAEIQAELAGATDDALAAVARIPGNRPGADVLPAAPTRFWTRSAGGRELDDADEDGDGDGELAGTAVGARGAVGDGERGRLVHGVRLAAGVTLLLEGAAREPGPDDVDAILNSARARLAELAGRGLREPGAEHPADAPHQYHLE